MDIRPTGAEPTDAERAAVDAVLGAAKTHWEGAERDSGRDGRTAKGGREARDRRHLLLPALHAIQDRIGWVSEGALDYACRRLTVPPAEAWGVVSFYHLFSTEPRAPIVAHVCDDLACRAHGAEALCHELEHVMGPAGGSVDGGRTTWTRSPCLGLCERAPAALVVAAGEEPSAHAVAPVYELVEIRRALADPAALASAQAAIRFKSVRESVPQAGSPDLVLLARVGTVDPTSFDAYRASGGIRALERAIALGPDAVVAEVVASKLVGRGGAAFPTGRKWQAVAQAPARPHYVVCNADESEPGTFKDRVLMEEDPFAVLEAMTIAAFACRATKGFVYLRGEYPLAHERLSGAIRALRAARLLGANILGSDLSFDVEIRRGAGAYICGEETALFNSIEGKRGEPRSKPPFPVEVGLFGRPTVVNNVETLANILPIVLEGGEKFAGVGTAGSTGPKLFCLSGHVTRPGLYEVKFGTTLAELLELAGGVREGSRLGAILLGGAAGAFVGPDQVGTPLTFEGTRAIGATLGSGVVLVYDDTADLGDALVRIAEFFRHESCGQCVPCRVGTVRQQELLERLRKGSSDRAFELALYQELAQGMRDASICGLGQTASSAIESALAKFELFRPAGEQGAPTR